MDEPHMPPVDAVQYPQAPEERTSAADLMDYVRTMARTSGQYGMSLGPEQTRTVLGYVDELLEQIEKLKAESARLTETIVYNREQYAKERAETVASAQERLETTRTAAYLAGHANGKNGKAAAPWAVASAKTQLEAAAARAEVDGDAKAAAQLRARAEQVGK